MTVPNECLLERQRRLNVHKFAEREIRAVEAARRRQSAEVRQKEEEAAMRDHMEDRLHRGAHRHQMHKQEHSMIVALNAEERELRLLDACRRREVRDQQEHDMRAACAADMEQRLAEAQYRADIIASRNYDEVTRRGEEVDLRIMSAREKRSQLDQDCSMRCEQLQGELEHRMDGAARRRHTWHEQQLAVIAQNSEADKIRDMEAARRRDIRDQEEHIMRLECAADAARREEEARHRAAAYAAERQETFTRQSLAYEERALTAREKRIASQQDEKNCQLQLQFELENRFRHAENRAQHIRTARCLSLQDQSRKLRHRAGLAAAKRQAHAWRELEERQMLQARIDAKTQRVEALEAEDARMKSDMSSFIYQCRVGSSPLQMLTQGSVQLGESGRLPSARQNCPSSAQWQSFASRPQTAPSS